MTSGNTSPSTASQDIRARLSVMTAATPGGSASTGPQTTSKSSREAWGYGLATITDAGATLDTWYPRPPARTAPGTPGCRTRSRPTSGALEGVDPRRGVRQRRRPHGDRSRCPARRTSRTPTCACTCSHTGWSPRTAQNLNGIFGVLPNVVWTDHGPCAVDDFENTRLRLLGGRSGAGDPEAAGSRCSAWTSSRG